MDADAGTVECCKIGTYYEIAYGGKALLAATMSDCVDGKFWKNLEDFSKPWVLANTEFINIAL